MRKISYLLLALIMTPMAYAAPQDRSYVVLEKKSEGLPVTAMNITFRVGSADDPKETLGLAHLTARLLREGGVKASNGLAARSRAELEEFLFPFAADIHVSVAKEQISFTTTAAASDAHTVFNVLAQMITSPAFNEAEFSRIKAETLEALQKQWPREDQEELGKAVLEREIFGAEHPYAHVVEGTVAGVTAASLENVKEFYVNLFTKKRLTVGLAGVIQPNVSTLAARVFKNLPEGVSSRAVVPPALDTKALTLTLVKGPFDAVGVHLGEPLAFNRGSADFDAMYLMALGFGKHRSFVGRLMKSVRETRSMNYGTYSYIEEFPNGGAQLVEPTQVARQRQAFTIWGRPTPLNNGCFLLRLLHRETRALVEKGLTEEEFKLTQSHLVGNAPLLATGIERRLGYLIDSKFYGIAGDYLMRLQQSAKRATRSQVHAVLKKNIHPDKMHFVVVTPEPEKFKEQILGARCEIEYAAGTEKTPELLKEDSQIATYDLGLKPENIQIINSEAVFAK